MKKLEAAEKVILYICYIGVIIMLIQVFIKN